MGMVSGMNTTKSTRKQRIEQTEAQNRLRLRHQLEAAALADYEAAHAAAGAARAAADEAEQVRVRTLAALSALVGSPALAGELTGQSGAAVTASVRTVDQVVVDELLGGWRRRVAPTGD